MRDWGESSHDHVRSDTLVIAASVAMSLAHLERIPGIIRLANVTAAESRIGSTRSRRVSCVRSVPVNRLNLASFRGINNCREKVAAKDSLAACEAGAVFFS